jgi:hypothetical protein
MNRIRPSLASAALTSVGDATVPAVLTKSKLGSPPASHNAKDVAVDLISTTEVGFVIPIPIFGFTPLTCNAPNEPVEVAEPLIFVDVKLSIFVPADIN